MEQPDNVVRLIHAKPDGTVYVLDFSGEEARRLKDKIQAAPTFWLDVSFASAAAPKFSEGQWTRLANLLVLGAKSL